MHYQKITLYDTSNGPGIRTVLWTSGCSHNCLGCHNPETHDPDSGRLFTSKELKSILDSLSPKYIAGLTFSGGDPLYKSNIDTVTLIARKVKEIYPTKSIWLWTGYLYEDVSGLEIMNYLDVLVDGPFILSKRDITLPYRGSPNQRVIDVVKSRESNKVILYTK